MYTYLKWILYFLLDLSVHKFKLVNNMTLNHFLLLCTNLDVSLLNFKAICPIALLFNSANFDIVIKFGEAFQFKFIYKRQL